LIIYFLIPVPKFLEPTSTVIYSKEHKLLGAKIAIDEQWRFPLIDKVPEKFKQSIIAFEDRCFNFHPGFNPISIVRAFYQNIKASKTISGGSTLTMQVVRLSRKGKPRTVKEKIIELVLATKLELKYTKNEILSMYASYAPFGGNVVGLEAASWRYYGRPPENLTWAESATLAVLPNAPSLIYPGKNQQRLKIKRNTLLSKLLQQGVVDSLTYKLALKENLPLKPKALPSVAPHLLVKAMEKSEGKKLITTLNFYLQSEAQFILNNHVKHLKSNEIYNAAALVIDNNTSTILVYLGNADVDKEHGNDVDIIQANRSTGSILKPFLFAALLNEGEILPNTLVPDIPVFMEGFSPKNYNLQFDGAVSATKALSRSLNVPAVHMLSKYGVSRFHNLLQKLGLKSITQAPEHYGLSLILGGAEANLWDLSTAYSGMARILKNTVENNYLYSDQDYRNIHFLSSDRLTEHFTKEPDFFSAASIWCTFQALQEVNRPESELGWKSFASANKIAWKTGTSFGFRDAWAVGVSSDYTVGVWVGNADGEGRPGLTGVTAAAPLMFDIFNILNPAGWFQEPFDEFVTAQICHESGFLASINCEHIDTVDIPVKGLRTQPCPYHKLIHLDKTERYQVNSSCENPEDIIQKSWFVLPPAMEFYFKERNPFYLSLPPYKKGCLSNGNENVMEFVYPKELAKIYIPVDVHGKKGEVIFEVAHRNPSVKLYWHIDNQFVKVTTDYHEIGVQPSLGQHTVTVVDEAGNSILKHFEIVSK